MRAITYLLKYIDDKYELEFQTDELYYARYRYVFDTDDIGKLHTNIPWPMSEEMAFHPIITIQATELKVTEFIDDLFSAIYKVDSEWSNACYHKNDMLPEVEW